jgi:hypothetical protein
VCRRRETLLFASQYLGGPCPGCGFTRQRGDNGEGDRHGRDDGPEVREIDHGWDAELAGEIRQATGRTTRRGECR